MISLEAVVVFSYHVASKKISLVEFNKAYFVRLSLETIFFQLSPAESFSFSLRMLLLEKMMERLIRAKKKCAGSSSYASTLYYISILFNNESFAALTLLACLL